MSDYRGHVLGVPYGKQVEDASPWLSVHPELTTRPELVAFMKIDKKFRHAVLKKLAILRAVPDIREDGVARHCLLLAYRQARRDLVDYWQARMDEAMLHDEMGQAVGVLRNVFINMLEEIDPQRAKGAKWGKHDVRLPATP